MPTVAFSNSTRDQLRSIIDRRLTGSPSAETRLAEFGDVVVVALLLDLEEHFGILIDVDEALPGGSVGSLMALTERRILFAARRNAAARAPATLCDLAEYRARRARAFEIPAPPATAQPPHQPIAVPSDEANQVFKRESRAGTFAKIIAIASIGLCLTAAAALAMLQQLSAVAP